jgi:hypothetical protein
MEAASCLELFGNVCGGPERGACVGNGTCVCFEGFRQSNELHYAGAWSGRQSAPCVDNSAKLQGMLVVLVGIFGVGLLFQLSITRTLGQLARTGPTLLGYSLVAFPCLVRLVSNEADIGLASDAAYSACIAFAISAFFSGVAVL